MWKALGRAGEDVGRDRVRRLMAANDIQGAKRRGKPWWAPAAGQGPDDVEHVVDVDVGRIPELLGRLAQRDQQAVAELADARARLLAGSRAELGLSRRRFRGKSSSMPAAAMQVQQSASPPDASAP